LKSIEAARHLSVADPRALQRAKLPEAERPLQASPEPLPDRVSTLTNSSAVQTRVKQYRQVCANARRSVKVDSSKALGWMNLGVNLFHHLGQVFVEIIRRWQAGLPASPLDLGTP
jgi:hypothetical protein